jgi:hypothetical protein
MAKHVILKREDGDALEHLPALLESLASIVGDEDLSADEREAMLRATFDEYEEYTGRDGLEDLAATRSSKAEKGIEQMGKVDVGELAQVVLEGAAVALRKREPNLTAEQAYSRVYQDPHYREAIKAERQASRARIAGVGIAQTEPEILNVLSDADIKRLIARERARFPFLDGAQLLARVEATQEMVAHRAALRQREAAARRDGWTWLSAAVTKRDDAMNELRGKADELRKADPRLSPEAAFAKAFRAYPELAAKERAASRAALYP